MSKFNEAVENETGRFSVVGGTPSRLKKITATRFSKVIDCNHWATPFQAWCEVMKVAEPPFEDNKYTLAGKAIEPKLIDWVRDCVSPYIQAPSDYFDNCEHVYDYFPNEAVFGGMWDALAFEHKGVTEHDNDKPIAVIEAKTTSRPQDWEDGVPENYKAQGLMYAYLLGVKDVYFPVAFLTDEDYEHPEDFVCTEENTRVYHITVDEAIGEFENVEAALNAATEWHDIHVDGNVSPMYNDKKDAEYLAILRQCEVSKLQIDSDNLESLCAALYELDTIIENVERDSGLTDWKEKRKTVNKMIQEIVKPVLANIDGKDTLDTEFYKFNVAPRRSVDYAAMERDGVTERYVKTTNAITTKRK